MDVCAYVSIALEDKQGRAVGSRVFSLTPGVSWRQDRSLQPVVRALGILVEDTRFLKLVITSRKKLKLVRVSL